MKLHSVESDGFQLVNSVCTEADAIDLRNQLGPVEGAGRRGLLSSKWIADIANSESMLNLVRPYLPLTPKTVRAIYFDKSPSAN